MAGATRVSLVVAGHGGPAKKEVMADKGESDELSSESLLRSAKEVIGGRQTPDADEVPSATEALLGRGDETAASPAQATPPTSSAPASSDDLLGGSDELLGMPTLPARPATPPAPPRTRSTPVHNDPPVLPSMPGQPPPPNSPASAMPPMPPQRPAPQPRQGGNTPAPPPNMGINMPTQNRPVNTNPLGRRVPWRPILIGGAFVIFAFFGWLGSRGTTSGSSLDVGDCFAIPDLEFTSVTDQPCDAAHEAQIFAEVDAIDSEDGFEKCINAFIAETTVDIDLPEDFALDMLSIDGRAGSTDWFCVLTSPSASLVGSVVDN